MPLIHHHFNHFICNDMKNLPFFLLFSASLFILNACQKEPETSAALPVSSEAILSWQECHDFTDYDMTVCFTAANEYRCPCDVDCVWAGSVDYMLTIKTSTESTTVTLQPPGNPNSAPSSAVVGKVTISIQEATPVDCVDYGNFEQYKLKVVLSSSTGDEF